MKPGDVVILKSGGPLMTIENLKGKFVKCVWFSDGECFDGTFHKACLKLN